MARWPRHFWTSLFTYGIIFVGFPLISLITYAWVQQMGVMELIRSFF